jgi:hypothetical protein
MVSSLIFWGVFAQHTLIALKVPLAVGAILKPFGDAELGVNRAIHHRDAGLLAVGNDLLQADLAVAQKRHKRNEHGISIRRMIRLVLPCSVHAN